MEGLSQPDERQNLPSYTSVAPEGSLCPICSIPLTSGLGCHMAIPLPEEGNSAETKNGRNVVPVLSGVEESSSKKAAEVNMLLDEVAMSLSTFGKLLDENASLRERVIQLQQEREHLHGEVAQRLSPEPSCCGVAGHFKFQMNGNSCLMCQREKGLVKTAEVRVERLEKALSLAMEWAAKYPLGNVGITNTADAKAAEEVYEEARRALDPEAEPPNTKKETK